jgi:hypothetical protein
MEFHPKANIFPMMSAEEFKGLKSDIAENGLQDPIWTYRGQIIDGRNRYQACEAVGVKPEFREWNGKGSLTAFVVSKNLHRRHLDESQRSMVGARIKPMFEEEARERQRGGQGGILLSANLRKAKSSAEEAAEVVNVSPRSVDNGTKVLKTNNPKLIKAVEDGLLAVSTAAKHASPSYTEAEQNALVDRQIQRRAEGRKPRSRPAEARQNGQDFESNRELKGVGTIRAREAIDCLRRIPKNDALRNEGFDDVEDWIRRNRKV